MRAKIFRRLYERVRSYALRQPWTFALLWAVLTSGALVLFDLLTGTSVSRVLRDGFGIGLIVFLIGGFLGSGARRRDESSTQNSQP
jgi:hypothetical protein